MGNWSRVLINVANKTPETVKAFLYDWEVTSELWARGSSIPSWEVLDGGFEDTILSGYLNYWHYELAAEYCRLLSEGLGTQVIVVHYQECNEGTNASSWFNGTFLGGNRGKPKT